jgi:hypothetical protein
MCVFICANPKAHEWLGAMVDQSYRQALQLCVWPGWERETSCVESKAEIPRTQSIPNRLAVVGHCQVDWRVRRVGCQPRRRRHLSKQQKSLNPFTEAWAFLWEWIWGGR